MKTVRIGTRGSKLALVQTDLVAGMLAAAGSGLEIEQVIIHTKGDKLLDVALSKIGDKGLFTKEIEERLLAGDIDLAVHSMKDVPTVLEPGLTIGAVVAREDPSDVLLSEQGFTLDTLPEGAKVGTSSLRRRAQLLALRPDLRLVDLRGNLDTRVRKMREEGLDAIILAWAGVKRMGFSHLVSEVIPENVLLPAVGQGAIAVEVRGDDDFIRGLVGRIDDRGSRAEVTAERAFMRGLDGGCQIPIGARAVCAGGRLTIAGVVSDLAGRRVIRVAAEGEASRAEEVGRRLAEEARRQGAEEILESIRRMGGC